MFSSPTGKEKILVYLFHGLQASDGVLRSRIYSTVRVFGRLMFFYIVQIGATYAYAAGTSASAEASVADGNTGSEIGIKYSGRPSTCKFGIFSPSQVTRAKGIGVSGGACGADATATAKKSFKSGFNRGQEVGFL